MKVYVINLARSPERRMHMLRELRKAGIDYEFVEGIDGRDLDLSDTSLVDPTWRGKSPLWPGVAGAYLSHLKVYKKALEDGTERALVLEDDVVLPTDISTLVEAASTCMTGAEVVLLQYFSCTSLERGEACKFNKQGSVRLPSGRVLAFPVDVNDLGGAGAYLVTRLACQRMVQGTLPISFPIDDWVFFCREGILDKVRCVVPIPVRINSAFRTTIDHYEYGTFQTRLREAAIRIPVLSQALTTRRRRIMMRKTMVELVDGS